ncbi:LON peptidase substrate-binding domain-containing protein [Salinibacterium sp. ZJ450]|uniref:LON peptidase substrate-binding domain-containing protein n=1 Tax=Salinibacterium sp. ZJ450 TaxID=2708338 RepID=UPI0014225A80|nr:LON peptidase substrate-binding domain-containing protein [Salinibacterium sp. ZJ450]
MTTMPMFPLASVLFPAMPTALRIFEERYFVMLARVLQAERPEFGIVLIERGSEAGGGEQRFGIATVARITQLRSDDGTVGLLARGERRIEVTRWLADDPHPQAEVRDVPELEWSDELQPLHDEAERLVRRTLAQASEFTEQSWPADVGLSENPIDSSWQLAGIAPVGPLDQIHLLQSATTEQLLRGVIEATTDAAEVIAMSWDEDMPPADDAD